MKRAFVALTAFSVFVLVAGSALAGGIDHKTNFSAEYARTMNRNAAIDYADAVVYNPAGTAFMADGLYLNGSLQYLDKSYTNTIDDVRPRFFRVGVSLTDRE